ncbi:uncharacterized protein LOC112023359 isoform X1 [Quercus suber]|uniref:uncharacterized protein LOC112023359 isoform X1 n=1 Tax=Quercus suber TaxID=58331 RepID=UPI0032DFD197
MEQKTTATFRCSLKRRKKKQYGGGETLDIDSIIDNTNIMVDMRAKRIVLSEHVTRRDIVVNKKQSDEQGQSLGSGRFGPDGNGSQRNYGGADGYQHNNGGRNGYQWSDRRSDGYQPNNGGVNGYNGGTDRYQSNNGGRNGY